MKKIKLLLLCCLLSFTSFAGSPKYMQVLMVFGGLGSGMNLYIINESGKIEEQKLKGISNGIVLSPDKVAESHREFQVVLNGLGEKGWKIVGVSNVNKEQYFIVNYLLSKEE